MPQAERDTIENEFIRLQAVGGRDRGVRLTDKRQPIEHAQISVWLREESDVPVQFMVQQSTLVLSATDWKGRVTWHASFTLEDDVAAVSVRLAAFNRSFSPVFCAPHIIASPSGSMAVVPVRYAAERYEIGGASGIVGSSFGRREFYVAPLDTGLVGARILPCSLGRIDYASKDLASRLDDNELIIASAEDRPGHRLLVGVEGRTVEMSIDLSPNEVKTIDLAPLNGPVEVFQVRSPRGEIVLDSRLPTKSHRELPAPIIWSLEPMLDDDTALASAEQDPSVAHAATFARGLLQMRARNWTQAADLFEDSLLRVSTDPLAWWAKNWCLRELNSDNEHDLANAHYLAPMEPILRADAYLSAPEAAKPDHLLDAWDANPQPFLEVADLLASAGLIEQRVRWLEEARRRAPCSLLERLLAAAHLEHGRELAASEHIAFAKDARDTESAFRRSEVQAEAMLNTWHP